MSASKVGSTVIQMDPVKSTKSQSIPIPKAGAVRSAHLRNNGSYVILSPVLVPYVQAPVQYVKAGSKKAVNSSQVRSKGAVPIRYMPTVYSCSPQYVASRYVYPTDGISTYVNGHLYNKQARRLMQSDAYPLVYAAPQSIGHYTPLHNGYVSALNPPSSYCLSQSDKAKTNSKLNPLSEPYTPPSRSNNRLCLCDPARSGTPDEVWCCNATNCSRSSTPDTWGGEETSSTAASRSVSPVVHRLDKMHSKEYGSDTDSGVEAESDSESWRYCSTPPLVNDGSSNADGAGDYPDFRIPRNDEEKLPVDSTHFVDFVCSHLCSHEWRSVARELGVDEVIIQSVDYDIYDSFREEMRYVFSYWLRSEENQSCSLSEVRERLNAAFNEVGRSDLVDKLHSDSD